MKLIDADALHRKVKTETNPYGKPTIDYDSGVKVLEWIDKAHTIDAVPVVRCKDCKHCDPENHHCDRMPTEGTEMRLLGCSNGVEYYMEFVKKE